MGFKASLKQLIRTSLEKTTKILGSNKVGRIVFEQMVNLCMQRTQRINHQGLEMCFSVPNELNHFRCRERRAFGCFPHRCRMGASM